MLKRFLTSSDADGFCLPCERLDDLQLDGLKIFQDPLSYCFTSDSVLLANFAKAKRTDCVVDLCSGSGIVGILVAHKTKCKKVVCVEIQEKLALLSQKTINYINKTSQISVLNDTVQSVPNYIENGSVNVVVCNPPYKRIDASMPNKNNEIAIARHELFVNLKEIICVSEKLLKFGGKFYVCNDASRLAELVNLLKEKKLEPKRMFFTYPSLTKNASIVFVEAIKGGKEGVVIMPPIVSNDSSGEYLPTIQKLFKGEEI